MSDSSRNERLSRILGEAVTSLWADLPKDVQHGLFELSVLLGHETEQDENLRERLAQHLHQHHRRTGTRG